MSFNKHRPLGKISLPAQATLDLKSNKLLSITFIIDGLLAIGFGMTSWLFPYQTYATIVDLTNASPTSLTIATLSSQSIFYVLIGFVCFVSAKMPFPYSIQIALIMLMRHLWVGIHGYQDIGQDWLIGNPWPDIIIHTAFFCTYSALIISPLIRGTQHNRIKK